MTNAPQTVIGVPGRWRDQSDIVTSIASRSGGYLFAGMVMMKIGTKEGFTLKVYEHDPKLQNAFAIAGHGRLADEDLRSIGSHTFTLYLQAPGSSVDAARYTTKTTCSTTRSAYGSWSRPEIRRS